MKKVISVVLALVMCFALAVPAFAADNEPAVTLPPVEDITLPEIDGIDGDTMGKVMEAVQEVLANLGDTEFGNLNEFAAAFRNALAEILGEETMNKITDFINSNEFLKWLASIYTGSSTVPETEAPTTEAPEETTTEAAEEDTTVPPTGDSAVALAVFATVSVAAAAAFVCTKKKA